MVELSPDQLKERWLAYAVRGETPLSEIFSHDLSAVAPGLIFGNSQMRKNKKADLMNELLSKQATPDLCTTSHLDISLMDAHGCIT